MLNEIHLFQGPTKASTAPSGGWWGLTLIGALHGLFHRNTIIEHMRVLDREKDRYSDINIPLAVLKCVKYIIIRLINCVTIVM